jgi:hypothetical protein
MSTLPTPEESNIIKRVPFVSAELGEIIAWHDYEGPSIDFKLAPEDSPQRFDMSFSPARSTGWLMNCTTSLRSPNAPAGHRRCWLRRVTGTCRA